MEEFNNAPPPLPPSTGSVRPTFVANLRYYENDTTKDKHQDSTPLPQTDGKKNEVEMSGEPLGSHKETETVISNNLTFYSRNK